MRLGVLDVGSNTVHLLVVDAHPGARPWPAYSHKLELRLSEHLTADGRIDDDGADALVAFVAEALQVAEDQGTEDLLAFATSAIREAANGEEVLARVCTETGADLQVLPGEAEARFTFLAARRWFGWSSGRLFVADIGGGSLETASGTDEEPDVLSSLPLGAGRLTRDFLPDDPPGRRALDELTEHVRAELEAAAGAFRKAGAADVAVATSKTLRQLARMAGSAPSSDGPYVTRWLKRADLASWVPLLAQMSNEERANLPGVSAGRAPQLLAGAVVALTLLEVHDLERLKICPWALREGIILRRLDWMSGS
ncbi:MAG: exopolyphosphatase / guanosine-5-triphosphate,3-diphosphate pyrophosphatase [Actinomycetota bacterium]|nr:exopolyphosphatase / guanosine-5-triphosphate,3-diphosphate pyrophosphatase [Actinomycetota bacterium]